MCGLASSAYERDSTVTNTPISSGTKILQNDIIITRDMLNGDSGLLRIWWSFTTGADYAITITKKGEADLTGFPLIVNPDNDFILKNNGYYRFDIGVKVGDLINMSSVVDISKVNEIQIQQIQIGA